MYVLEQKFRLSVNFHSQSFRDICPVKARIGEEANSVKTADCDTPCFMAIWELDFCTFARNLH